jgi:hypothetical protein
MRKTPMPVVAILLLGSFVARADNPPPKPVPVSDKTSGSCGSCMVTFDNGPCYQPSCCVLSCPTSSCVPCGEVCCHHSHPCRLKSWWHRHWCDSCCDSCGDGCCGKPFCRRFWEWLTVKPSRCPCCCRWSVAPCCNPPLYTYFFCTDGCVHYAPCPSCPPPSSITTWPRPDDATGRRADFPAIQHSSTAESLPAPKAAP